jgi:hypothetical protein
MITAGVVGSPISHSLSPLLHNTVYDFLGIKATYLAYEVESGTLQRFLENDNRRTCKHRRNFVVLHKCCGSKLYVVGCDCGSGRSGCARECWTNFL